MVRDIKDGGRVQVHRHCLVIRRYVVNLYVVLAPLQHRRVRHVFCHSPVGMMARVSNTIVIRAINHGYRLLVGRRRVVARFNRRLISVVIGTITVRRRDVALVRPCVTVYVG